LAYLILSVIWIIVFSLVLPKTKKGDSVYKQQSRKIANIVGDQKSAIYDGVNLSKKESLAISLGSVLVGILIAYLLHNYFFLAVGMTLSYMLPRYIFSKLKRNHRQKILFELPDNLRVFTSKLNDFPSVLAALEQSVPDMYGETKEYFYDMLTDLKTGFSLDSALSDIKQKIQIKRFDDFAEKLQVAEEQGFHERAIQSLKETAREMTEDNLILKDLQIKAKKDMRNLYVITIMAWVLPITLSTVNTDNSNVYLDTVYGQAYITLFVLITLYSIVKAEDYISLNLDAI